MRLDLSAPIKGIIFMAAASALFSDAQATQHVHPEGRIVFARSAIEATVLIAGRKKPRAAVFDRELHFFLLLGFAGCTRNDKGVCVVDVDLRIFGPDGALEFEQNGYPLRSCSRTDESRKPWMLSSPQEMKWSADDHPGKYRAVATFYDRVSRKKYHSTITVEAPE